MLQDTSATNYCLLEIKCSPDVRLVSGFAHQCRIMQQVKPAVKKSHFSFGLDYNQLPAPGS
jgi:hypothetical protein